MTITTKLYLNKSATDEHLIRYLYTGSDETHLVYKYILRGLAGKGAQANLNRHSSSRVDKGLNC
jgi:hypothetical protein